MNSVWDITARMHVEGSDKAWGGRPSAVVRRVCYWRDWRLFLQVLHIAGVRLIHDGVS